LQHIDFPLPRKHKPALFIAIGRTPLTTMPAPMRKMRRLNALTPACACLPIILIQIVGNRITTDSLDFGGA
jgi:hypothetical protein